MKSQYRIAILVIIAAGITYLYKVLNVENSLHPRLDDVLQGFAILVALVVSIIALSTADPKERRVKVDIRCYPKDDVGKYLKSAFTEELKTKFKDHIDPVTSRPYCFELTNRSGISLTKPVLTFRLPSVLRHSAKNMSGVFDGVTFNSNLYNSTHELRTLEMDDSIILSNSSVAYWNEDEKLTIWIRMVFDKSLTDDYSAIISVNCENAEGVTNSISINGT